MTRSFTALDVEALNHRFAEADAGSILDFALETFGPSLAFACSLGLEDAALMEIISRRAVKPRVFFLDTGRLHPETYDTLARLQERYGIAIETYFPEAAAVEAFVNARGPNAFYDSLELRKACCAIRKVEPLNRALKGAEAWITGLRREQAATRSGLGPFEVDGGHGGILKVNPLIGWSHGEVRAFVRDHGIPINPLHDAGYPSIGCAPCTRAVLPGEDIRAGRWWWEQPEHKECGLHTAPPAAKGA
ncbi:MAG TPA: phosphoadenylyl-sulfate reductase [Holophagaceae bacterium]|nr:phosphoadenylyl-sulfate reductase [Holophagaceae bacterium]